MFTEPGILKKCPFIKCLEIWRDYPGNQETALMMVNIMRGYTGIIDRFNDDELKMHDWVKLSSQEWVDLCGMMSQIEELLPNDAFKEFNLYFMKEFIKKVKKHSDFEKEL